MDLAFYREEEFQETRRGKFPKDWKILRFDKFLSIEYGKGLPEQRRVQGVYPVVGSNGVIGYHNRALVRGPGIVIGRKGTIGAVTWIDSDFWPIDTTYYVKVASDDVYLKWLFYELVHLNLPKLSLADVVPGLKRELVNNLVLPLPPIAEQRAIVGVLGVVDSAIELVDRVIAKTERLKKGLMQELLTKGIGHKEFKDTEIGRIPREWEVVRVKDVGKVVNGFGFPVKYQGKKNEEYLFVKVSDTNLLRNEKFVFTTENTINEDVARKLRVKIYPQGTIIFPKIGMVIYLRKVRILAKAGTFDNNIMGIIPDRDVMDREFLYYYLLERIDLTKLAGRTTAPSIKKSEVEKLKISLPPLQEQQKISEIVSTVDKKLEIERNEKARLERIKQGLMDLLLTGKIRVKVD